MREILGSTALPALAELDVSNNPVAAADLLPVVLDAAPRPELAVTAGGLTIRRWCAGPDVRVAVEHETNTRDDLFAGLRNCAAAKRVTSFRLSRVEPGRAGIGSLAAGLSPDALRELEIADIPLRNDGAATLAAAFGGYRLAALRLPNCRIQASGAASIAGAPWAASLVELDLSRNSIGKGGAEALTRSPHMGGLNRLILTGWNAGEAERKALLTRFGENLNY